MHDIVNADLQCRIDAFLNRKAKEYPELRLNGRISPGTLRQREEKTWKYSRAILARA